MSTYRPAKQPTVLSEWEAETWEREQAETRRCMSDDPRQVWLDGGYVAPEEPKVMDITAENIADKLAQGMPGYWEAKAEPAPVAQAETVEMQNFEAEPLVDRLRSPGWTDQEITHEQAKDIDQLSTRGTVDQPAVAIVQAPNPMPPLDEAIRAALRSSIARFGVLVPVVKDLDGHLLDGHHRKSIADELEKPCPEVVIAYRGQEAAEIAVSLNLDRRHLSVEQRRNLVIDLRQQGHSERVIAGALGVSQPTVHRDLQLNHGESLPERIIGMDGKSRPSTRPQPTEPEPVAETEQAEQVETNDEPEEDPLARKRAAAEGSDLAAKVRAYGKEPKPEPKHSAIATVLVGEIRKANRALRKALKQYHDEGLCFVGEDREWANECLDECSEALDQLRTAINS